MKTWQFVELMAGAAGATLALVDGGKHMKRWTDATPRKWAHSVADDALYCATKQGYLSAEEQKAVHDTIDAAVRYGIALGRRRLFKEIRYWCVKERRRN